MYKTLQNDEVALTSFYVWSFAVLPYLPVAPQLVALHAVAVVQRDGAVVGDGVEADLFSVHGVADTDVLSPAECEHLQEINLSCDFFVSSCDNILM